MNRETGRRGRRMTGVSSTASPGRGRGQTFAIEPLEGRQLLSHSSGQLLPRAFVHTAGGAAFQIQVTGPGFVTTMPIGHGQVAINLLGTTQDSQVTVTPKLIRPRFAGNHLQIGQLNVRSGQLGSFQAANTADLVGPMTPLNGTVSSLQFDALGGSEQIQANGTLGQLVVTNNATLPAGGGILVNGPVSIGGNLNDNGQLTATTVSVGGSLALNGTLTATTLTVGGSLADGGSLNAGGTTVGGNFLVAGKQAELGGGNLKIGGDLDVNSGGVLHLAGDRTAPIVVGGSLNLDNGRLAVDRDVLFGIQVGGNLTAVNGGALTVGRDLLGGTFNGSSSSTSTSSITGTGNGSSSSITGGGSTISTTTSNNGNSSTSTSTITTSTATTINGLVVTGDIVLASGGTISVGRDVALLQVGGNLDTSGGGKLKVGGNVDALTVTGVIKGRYTPVSSSTPFEPASAADISIGLDLDKLQVLGGVANQGSILTSDIDVGKSINGFQVNHGIFNSLITAGVAIDGTGSLTTAPTNNIGPDGSVAVFDSTILANVQIKNLTIGGDVKSDMPTNPARIPTRISAGLDRQNNLSSGSNIDNFQITGALIDAVLASAVKPFGGTGRLTNVTTNTPGDNGHNTYDAPAGTIRVGFVNGPNSTFLNFTAPPYNRTTDPTIDDTVFDGSINRSFAPPIQVPNPGSTTVTSTGPSGTTTVTTVFNNNGTETITTISPNGTFVTTIPSPNTVITLPTKSTVLGGVISTKHGDEADYAGIFAADTAGVFVGALPKFVGA